jgi:RHS repeat-associated protein
VTAKGYQSVSQFALGIAFLLLTVLPGATRVASAQVVPPHPRPFVCMPGQPGCPTHPVSATVSPNTETTSTRNLAVTVTFCDSASFTGPDSVVFNGTNNTSAFTVTNTSGSGQCAVERILTATLPLSLGANTITGYVYNSFNGNFTSATASATYTYVPPKSVSVTPKGSAQTVATGPNDSVTFTVTSLESVSDSAIFTCSAPAIASCTVVSGKRLGAEGTAPISVHFNQPGQATGPVTLIASMVGTLSADTGTINLTLVDRTRVLRIVAGGGIQQVLPSAAIIVPFTVTNNGNFPDTVTLSTACAGSALSGSCSTSQTTVPLAAGASKADTIRVTAGTTIGATGTVGVVGVLTTAGVRDSAYTDITIRAARSHGVELASVNDLSQQTPYLCYARAIVPRAAYECGNLRIAHALPAVRTYEKTRIPTLLYSSQLAHPHPVIAAIFTFDSTKGTPDSVIGQLQDGSGTILGQHTWPGASFAHGASRQVTIGYDANGVTTNEYTWKVQAQAFSGDSITTFVTNEFYALVSAQASHLGHGWTVAGIESMHVYSCLCSMLWSSGDGSAEFYSNQNTGNASVFAPTSGLLTHPDTIKTDHSTGVLRYIRYAPHGVQIIFDSLGQHIQTRDRLGHVTTMTWVNATDIGSITVPAPGATLTYTFVYDGTTHMLDSVIAPSTAGEPTRATKLTTNSSGDVTAIRDPDGVSVTFNYRAGGDADVITSLVDRRGTLTAFTYDAARELATATIDSVSGGFKLTATFSGANASTLTAALNPDSVSMLVHGPRSDVGDTSRIWMNRFGQPVRIRDAFGYETDLTVGNPTYLAQVTRVRDPNGHVISAVYDPRGNLQSETDSNIVSAGTYATTAYRYDGTFDFTTKIDPPLHDSTVFTYDPVNGNRLTSTNALGSSTTIHYYYGNADSLLSSTQPPNTAKDSIEYDPVFGNVVAEKTPLGYWTLTRLDGYGRDSLQVTPIPAIDKWHDPDPDTSVRDTSEMLYDRLDRPTYSLKIAPAYNGVGRQMVSLTTTYDNEGAVLSSQTQPSPDPNNIQSITTTHFYDRVGRLSYTLHPDGSKDSTYYDAGGNADTLYTRRLYKIAQSFDALNRITKRIVPSVFYPTLDVGIPADSGYPSYHMAPNLPYGNLTVPGDSAALFYDEVGNLVEADNADARVSRVYDAAGRMLTETQRVRTRDNQNFNVHVYTVTHGYNLDSRRAFVVHPSQLAAIVSGQARDTALYTYDAAGELQTVRDPLGGTFTYGYSARGDLVSLAFPDNATIERFGTDDDGRLTNDSIGPLSGPANARKTLLTYDARGKILTGANAFQIMDTVTTTYSAMGFVTIHNASFIFPGINGNPATRNTDNETYNKDPLGNDVSSTVATSVVTGTASDATINLELGGYRNKVGEQTVRQGGTAGNHGSADSLLYDPEGNLYMTYQTSLVQGDPAVDLASYYGADNKLRNADNRTVANPLARNETITTRAFETYRYDALGRRVLKQADLYCPPIHTFSIACNRSTLRRIIWDGAQELDEIQMQDTSVASIAEADTGVVQLALQCSGDCQDNNPYFGRVLYTHGLTTDQPLAVTRVDYADAATTVNGVGGTQVPYFVHPPLTIVPVWNAYGRWDAVLDYECVTMPGSSQPRCVNTQVQVGLNPYDNLHVNVVSYLGSLLEDKRDETGTRYRRSRTYNPTTGQFTQEDPIGLAGGLSAYGFAGGDPVNYSDPFGLCPQCAALLASAGLSELEPGVGTAVGAGLALTAGVLWLASKVNTGARADAISDTQSRTDDPVTVRLQAQGGGLEQSVVIQGAGSGVTAGDGLHGLEVLRGSLTTRDATARAGAFAKAARFITGAAAGGGTTPIKRSFPIGPGTDVRVDVEVLRGRAFTPGPRSEAIISQ